MLCKDFITKHGDKMEFSSLLEDERRALLEQIRSSLMKDKDPNLQETLSSVRILSRDKTRLNVSRNGCGNGTAKWLEY